MHPGDYPAIAEHDVPVDVLAQFDRMLKGNNSTRPLDGTTGYLSFSYDGYHKIIKVNGVIVYTKG